MLTTITAIAGLLFGLAGFILGLLNYRRDRPKIRVSLDWNRFLVRDKNNSQAKLGLVYITNAGRRPIYIVSAGVLFFTLSDYVIKVTTAGNVKGQRLAEGDAPLSFVVPHSISTAKILWEDHPEHWLYLRAYVRDSTGKRYLSQKPRRRPFWGIGDGKMTTDQAARMPTWEIECTLEQHELEKRLIAGSWHIHPLSHVLDVHKLQKAHSSWPLHLRGFPVANEEIPPFDNS